MLVFSLHFIASLILFMKYFLNCAYFYNVVPLNGLLCCFELIGACCGCVQETIAHMAEKYGFRYELVQYKWPRWLHQQTEKQRIIWGYKILFLDVLFPLAVDKIIFVDADQVRVQSK